MIRYRVRGLIHTQRSCVRHVECSLCLLIYSETCIKYRKSTIIGLLCLVNETTTGRDNSLSKVGSSFSLHRILIFLVFVSQLLEHPRSRARCDTSLLGGL